MITREHLNRILEVVCNRINESDKNSGAIKDTDDEFVIINGEEFEIVIDGSFERYDDGAFKYVSIDGIELHDFSGDEVIISLEPKMVKDIEEEAYLWGK